MIRTLSAALIATTLAAAAPASADDTHATSATPAATASMLQPHAGAVPLHIDVTETRAVYMAPQAGEGAPQFVCNTPCRVYVAPGPVAVTLVGHGAHTYHWEVPSHGGSVHLVARLPDGTLNAWFDRYIATHAAVHSFACISQALSATAFGAPAALALSTVALFAQPST